MINRVEVGPATRVRCSTPFRSYVADPGPSVREDACTWRNQMACGWWPIENAASEAVRSDRTLSGLSRHPIRRRTHQIPTRRSPSPPNEEEVDSWDVSAGFSCSVHDSRLLASEQVPEVGTASHVFTQTRRHVVRQPSWIIRLVRMSGDSGVGSGVLMLEWRSPGEGGVGRWFLQGGRVGSFYSGCCGLFVPDDLTAFMAHHVAAPHALPPYWWGGVRLQVGVADLTCARSVVRHLVPFVHPVDRSRRFGHVIPEMVVEGGEEEVDGVEEAEEEEELTLDQCKTKEEERSKAVT
ncbi:hypothetical protein GW17_00033553 [Ensete ventricosum]|nr:hypothetical protein GW17_00033553 [Ensete ventricosum]